VNAAVRLFRARLERRAAALAPDLRAELLRAWDKLRELKSETELARLIEAGRLEELLTPADIERAMTGFRSALRDGVESATRSFANTLPATARLVAFDVLAPQVVEGIRDLNTEVMKGLTEPMRETLRAYVENGIRDGLGPRQIARGLRDVIGLAPNQLKAVENFRRMLEEGDAEALTRALRDRRFDALLRKAVTGKLEPVGGWFGNSVVEDRNGVAKILYHGSTKTFEPGVSDIISRDIGFHAGSAEQASHPRFTGFAGGRVYPVYLKIENPLTMMDLGNWDADSVMRELFRLADKGDTPGLTRTVVSAIEQKRRALVDVLASSGKMTFEHGFGQFEQFKIIRGGLLDLGFDGIRYKNMEEGAGESWIAFTKEQVRSVFAGGKIQNPSGLSPAQIDRMTDAYRKRFVAFNAETNTRTAALDAQRLGQHLSWQQAVERGDIDGTTLTKRWSGTLDDRERDSHLEMEGETVPYDQPYSNGQMIPGDTEYNCRCVSIYETSGRVKPGAGAFGALQDLIGMVGR
jgi:hypothetical protein